ncbi:MAG TPA: pyridoxamine 5'-phosphate oxidase family protein [Bacteroidia bacterium]
MFFVATAPCEGKINLSPKGMNTFKVLDKNRVLWLNLTGSGNETAEHLLENGRITIMFCSFDDKPNILRLYGHARSIYSKDADWPNLIQLFPDFPGTRQLIDMTIDYVQNSCGMSIPILKFEKERDELVNWAEKMGETKINEYQQEKNKVSIDGKPTGL